MAKSIQAVPVIAAALMAFAATNAQAYIWSGDDTSYITNHTGGCVRAYVGNQVIDVSPHTTSYHFQVSPDSYYLVSVFPTAFCGNRAVRTIRFGGGSSQWIVNR